MAYDHKKIESKWQKIWEKGKNWRAKDFSQKPKFYLLVEFPYPSGQGLHVGHCRSYTAMDVIARKKRMEGYNVLFPMGWDAFGLPTENYALKTGIHPKIATQKNTDNFRRQLKALGFSFDWSREINTSDPEYYKWTQWIFLQLFKKGLAYKAKTPINWCPSCKIGLANEEVVEGRCERCGSKVVRKEKEQWLLKITNYAQRLIEDLDMVDYPERVKALQRDWIGKSDGHIVNFSVSGSSQKISVFTTRIETIFGATYLVLAPEHSFAKSLLQKRGGLPPLKNSGEVASYIAHSINKAERDRLSEAKEKTGVELKGLSAVNPATKKEIPIFLADYILPQYGTGAVMAVPAHDKRDFDFAKKHKLPVVKVIESKEDVYTGEGKLIHSGQFNGLGTKEAKEKIAQYLRAEKSVNYKLKDWVFSRQRYWGEPMPLVFCPACQERIEKNKNSASIKKEFNAGELLNPGWIAVREESLPVELPLVNDYKPTEEGDSPLAKISGWVKVKCPKCGGPAIRETDVMPNWAGSNWYFLRYCDPKNSKEIASQDKIKYWMPVDWYNGGMEHTTLHLLYSRFIYKFLWDIKVAPKSISPEPYAKRTSHGMVLGQGGIKMSKSRGNVINPNVIVEKYGADTMRIYEMFMGPFSQAIAWDTKGLMGVSRFIEKVWKIKDKVSREPSNDNKETKILVQKTIEKVSKDIEKMKFNTAVSALMVAANKMQKQKSVSWENYSLFLILLSPFAPHIAEEIWQKMGGKESIFFQKWPKYNEESVKSSKVNIIIQVNGKFRGTMKTKSGLSKEEIEKAALSREKVKERLKGKKVKKIIFREDRLINFVV